MKKTNYLPLVILLSLTLSLASCGGGGDGAIPPAGTLGDVQPLFALNGTSWNDYIQGGDITNATDTACDAASDPACLHAGEMRKLELAALSNCTGITAADSLGAFEWICDDSAGIAQVISNGLSSGYGLSNLIDFGAVSWKTNMLTINKDGSFYGISSSMDWWVNPVVANTTGGSLGEEGTVYVVPGSVDGVTYDLIANSVSLVAAPGVVINGPGTADFVIYGNNTDFVWVEGMAINATGDSIGVYGYSISFSEMRNLTAKYADAGANSTGIRLYLSDKNSFSGITASNNGQFGVFLQSSSGNTLTGITANSSSYGVYLHTGSDSNTFSGVTASNNGFNGVMFISTSDNNTLSDVTVSNNGNMGVALYSSGNTLSGVTSSNNDYGVTLYTSSDNKLSDMSVNNNVAGFYLYTSTDNTLSNMTSSNNGDSGFILTTSSDNNTLTDIKTANNTNSNVSLSSSSNNTISGLMASNSTGGIILSAFSNSNTLSGITASNNSWAGVYLGLSSNDNTFSDITATNNGDYGVNLESSANNNTLTGLTATNNGVHGVYLQSPTNNNTLSGITASNNGNSGIMLDSSNNTLSGITASNNNFGVYFYASSNNTLSGITASDNLIYGVFLTLSSDNYFNGPLKVGNNTTANCYVSGGTNPGLVDGTCTESGLTGSKTYGLGNISDALLTNSVSIAGAFVANITSDDSVNTSDTNGTALFDIITDGYGFENSYRGWGIWNADAFPSATHQGECSTGQTCQIWDWSALASDTVIVNSLSYPDTGDIANTLTHSWDGTPATSDNAGCDAMVLGSLWNTDHCETTLLRNAIEISDDSIGNDNTLCESGDECLYMPNMGSYQGHGAIVNSAPAFTNGAVLTGIALKEYGTNGY